MTIITSFCRCSVSHYFCVFLNWRHDQAKEGPTSGGQRRSAESPPQTPHTTWLSCARETFGLRAESLVERFVTTVVFTLSPFSSRPRYQLDRKSQTVSNILKQCYGDPEQVTDELVDCILTPGLEPGAVKVSGKDQLAR